MAPAPQSGSSSGTSDSTTTPAAGARSFSVPEQLLLSYGIGRLYDATFGPTLRQGVEKMFGRPYTPAYVPPMSFGFLVRDLANVGVSYVVAQKAFNFLSAIGKHGSKGANLLTASGGLAGAQATAGAFGLRAFERMAGQTLVMTVLFTALDAVMANYAGPRIEHLANKVWGGKHENQSTSLTNKDGTIPGNLMKVDAEQLSRNFAHNVLGSITYSATLATVGATAAKAVALRLPGPGGALFGALCSALIASAVVDVEDRVVGVPGANVAQQATRMVETVLGKPLSKHKPGDVIPVPGDRVNGSAKGVVVPFVTAMMSHNESAFIRSIAPPGTR